MKTEYKQVRLNPDVREQLDSYKMDGESYSIAIGRLFKENEILKDSHDRLMRMAMKTPDSIALPNINHAVFFALMEVLKMEGMSEDDKFLYLKIYLRPCLEKNSSQVYSIISEFKAEHDGHDAILDKLSSWIAETFEI